MKALYITNTLSKQKELFTPVNPGHVGLYVCGPTVYGDAHLGHARPAITYDVLVRLMRHLGYKVRYVRNITDVGHLEHDADEGEDKIAKKARLEQLEPMEVVQEYTERYHAAMRALNVAPPSIEPRASGHIIEQIALVKKILDAGYAYESNGSIYFDVQKYDKDHKYGILSGRNLDETLEGTRNLDGQGDKRAPFDFALWKKAAPEHIMHWPSQWSEGFPGWHLECSAMSEKYLGREFDIHGGGMDLMFPHHECEIAQNVASRGTGGVHYWMHNNMITINGKKMGKSLGNFITLFDLFSGHNSVLSQAYSPMTIRFFILQAHYRSTLDFSNEALQASEKGLEKVLTAVEDLKAMLSAAGLESLAANLKSLAAGGDGSVAGAEPTGVSAANGSAGDGVGVGAASSSAAASDGLAAGSAAGVGAASDSAAGSASGLSAVAVDFDHLPAASAEIIGIYNSVYDALCDDMNTPVALSGIFEAVKLINGAKAGNGVKLSTADLQLLGRLFSEVLFGILGLKNEAVSDGKSATVIDGLMKMVLEERAEAKATKNWAKSDQIRDALTALGITVKDTKDGAEWQIR